MSDRSQHTQSAAPVRPSRRAFLGALAAAPIVPAALVPQAAAPPAPPAVSGNEAVAEALVEEGLQLYSQGDLYAALSRWREALEAVPDHARAREYISYVRENR